MTDTLAPFAPPDRWVPLGGALNFRDIGGYLTTTGARVRWRRIFRSDALDDLTGGDRAVLTERLGLRTVLDLRCDVEGTPGALWAAGRIELPLVDVENAHVLFASAAALEDVYLNILRTRADAMRLAVQAIVEAEHPLVVHCTAGKDRTGLVAAVLLGALGVGDDDIVRDYALTATVLPDLLARLRRRPGVVLPPHAELAGPEAMRAVLRALRQAHGSMLGYVLDIGVSAEAVAVLRDRLLD